MNVMRTRRSESSSNLVPTKHQSVLLQKSVEMLDIHEDDTVVDATLGGAGHAGKIVQMLGARGLFIGFDLDSDAIDRAEALFTNARPKVVLINANFANLFQELETRGISRIDKALFDLGWSSDQLEAGRGFSFQKDEPLLMTFRTSVSSGDTDPSGKDAAGIYVLTAADIVNEWEESNIADVIFGWGEERYSRRIARAIVEARAKKPIQTSLELAEIIRKAVPSVYARGPRSRSSASQRGRRIHPATRTFQALRIAVNDEMGSLQRGLRSAWELLNPGGRIAVITFHSVEDRAVKQLFVSFEKRGEGTRITPKDSKLSTGQAKKPILPTKDETAANPRARSAKLRVIEKHHEKPFEKNKS